MRTYEAICWKCQRSRSMLEHKEKDPATGSHWYVITCAKCKTNVDIKDCYDDPPSDAPKTKNIIVRDKGNTIRKYYGFQ